jgi:hypothetical protein
MPDDNLTLEEYMEAVKNTLQYWLDIHTNAEKWAQAWIVDDDPQYTLKECPTISNDYFTFDLKAAVIKYWVRDNRHLFNVCKGCNCINETGYGCGCGEEKEGEGRIPSIVDLTCWMEDIGTDGLQIDDDQIIDALKNDGFKVYRAALKDIVAPVVGEVKDVLKSFRKAKNPAEILQCATWANHVCHVHGNIIKDYGEQFGIDYKTVDSVSQDGLQSIFSAEEIEEFLQGA